MFGWRGIQPRSGYVLGMEPDALLTVAAWRSIVNIWIRKLGLTGLVLALVGVAVAQIGAAATKGDSRVQRLLDQANIKYTIDDDGDYRLVFRYDDERTQLLFVNSRTERFQKMEIREVWSAGYQNAKGDIPQDVAMNLLRHNAKIKLGAWQVVESGGKDIALFCIQIDADANLESFKSAVNLAAEIADEKEKELLQTDDL